MKALWGICVMALVVAGSVNGQVTNQAATVAEAPGISGGGGSFTPRISGDGRYVVFVSQAKNLVTNGNQSPFLDVFVRDLTNGMTKLVSVNQSGFGGGDGDSSYPTISSNGQFIAFESTASNLTTNSDTNGVTDVFVRDMTGSTTWLVSKARGEPVSGSGASKGPIISRDGTMVVFESAATNVTVEAWDDTNGLTDVFVHDLLKHATHLVNTGATGETNTAKSEAAGISANGDWALFTSTATGMVPGANTQGDVYVRWTASTPVWWVSSNVTSLLSDNRKCFNPAISEDGRIVVFKVMTNAPTFRGSPVFVVRHDRVTGSSEILGTNSSELTWPGVSTDGRYVAFETQGLCGTEIVRYDAISRSNVVVSVDVSGTLSGSGDASTPVMTPDGSKVTFLFTYVPRDSAFCLGGPLTTNEVNDKTQLFLRDINAGTTRLISGRALGSPSSESLAFIEPSLSDDGSKVVFESVDALLVAEDRNGMPDAFVHQLPGGITELVSQRDAGLASQTSVGLNFLKGNCLSADGRYAVFASLDGNVTAEDTNGVRDVFVRDLLAGSNSLVSVRNPTGSFIGEARDPVLSGNGQFVAYVQQNAAGLPGRRWDVMLRDLQAQTSAVVSLSQSWTNANGNSYNPVISFDGRYVAFESTAGNLTLGSSGMTNVYVRDMVAGSNILVSANWTGTNCSDGVSKNPLISRTGRCVVFQSKASNLTTNTVSSGYYQLYARDLVSQRTTLLSLPEYSGNASGVSFSASGDQVLLSTDAGRIYVADLLAGTNQLVALSGLNPCLSADAQWIAYEETNTYLGIHQIALKNLGSGATRLITSELANPTLGNSHSVNPVITFDGRYVMFASKASDLVPGDTNGMSDIFMHDVGSRQTVMVSVNPVTGIPGAGTSARPVLGGDGRSVLFQNYAPDLVSRDYNLSRDILVLRLGAGDSDEDGLEDDWELAYFGSLARDGSGDLDGDGSTDAQECTAGTDPTNAGLVFRALTVSPAGGGAMRVWWSAVPGKTYRVEYKTNLTTSPWLELPGQVQATGGTAAAVDATAGPDQRYYRAVLLP